MSNDKHRPPDFYVSIAKPGAKGKEQFYDVGHLWKGKDGYMTGDSVIGRVIVTTREKREELEKLRREKQQNAEQEIGARSPDSLSQNP